MLVHTLLRVVHAACSVQPRLHALCNFINFLCSRAHAGCNSTRKAPCTSGWTSSASFCCPNPLSNSNKYCRWQCQCRPRWAWTWYMKMYDKHMPRDFQNPFESHEGSAGIWYAQSRDFQDIPIEKVLRLVNMGYECMNKFSRF